MSEPTGFEAPPSGSSGHPGQEIRAAREARGQSLLHLSILLKITERRLQAFEDGRWSEVGDTTFVRALAKSLCRHLEIDPVPILQSLPAARAEHRHMPDRGQLREGPTASLRTLRSPVRLPGQSLGGRLFTPMRLAVGAILIGVLILVFAPSSWWGSDPARVENPADNGLQQAPAGTPLGAAPAPEAASAPDGRASPPTGVVTTPMVASDGRPTAGAEPTVAPPLPAPSNALGSAAGTSGPAALPSATSSANPAAPLQISATQDTWIQVTDAQGQVLLSRLLRSGERTGVDGARPLRLRVGNVAGTEAVWQGRPVPLLESQRNNVADLQLP